MWYMEHYTLMIKVSQLMKHKRWLQIFVCVLTLVLVDEILATKHFMSLRYLK
jgi:hypothetical protein